MAVERIACFTGHRPQGDLRFDIERPQGAALARRVRLAVGTLCHVQGVRLFLCGMAPGFDLFAAKRLLEMHREGAIPPEVGLIAVIPYAGHALDVPRDWQPIYEQVLWESRDQCVVCPQKHREAFRKRNAFMVDRSEFVVAYWNHAVRSGTGMTVRMARRQAKVVINLYDMDEGIFPEPPRFAPGGRG